MSLPAGWTLVPVSGTYYDRTGAPSRGEVAFLSAQVIVVDGVVVVPAELTATLDALGHFEILLPATDDPNLNVRTSSYVVVERVENGRAPFHIFLPYNSAGVDLATVAPVVPPPLLGAMSAYNLSVGTVSYGALGATITGAIPNQQLNLTLPGGGGGAVNAVFGRTGDVVAATGDYTFAQIGATPTTLAGYGITDAPAAQISVDWNATSGIAEILNKPTLFSGSYTDLSSKPILFSGSYADLTNKPSFAAVATSGSYTDLANKPSIPAAQVNSDWNAASGITAILNKPILGTASAQATTAFATSAQGAKADSAVQPGSLATVATSGSYTDLSSKPTIPAAQVASDWNAVSGVSAISNKPTLGTAAATDSTAYATAAQGTLATNAMPKAGGAFSGAVTSSGTFAASNLSGTNTGDQTTITGNAGTATTLQTARTIAGVSFNGSANIAIPFANLASPPTTRSGYGITDAAPLVVPASALTTTSGVVAINCSLSQVFTLTTTANVTSITLSNVPAAGTAAFAILKITQGTTPYTIAWPASFKWPGGTAYVVSAVANAVDTIALMTVDGGTTWQAIGNKGYA